MDCRQKEVRVVESLIIRLIKKLGHYMICLPALIHQRNIFMKSLGITTIISFKKVMADLNLSTYMKK
jgi:hypothetical protein